MKQKKKKREGWAARVVPFLGNKKNVNNTHVATHVENK
jgi:hypothetical protein